MAVLRLSAASSSSFDKLDFWRYELNLELLSVIVTD